MEPCERALHLASYCEKQKVREVGRNGGLWVGRFLAAVGLGPGYSWCAAFVYWTLVESGADRKKLPSPLNAARVAQWAAWAKQNGRLTERPRRGDAFYWLNANGTGHTGLVRLAHEWPDHVETIEGNTDGSGSREGDGVYGRVRFRRLLEMNFESGFISLRGL